VSALLSLGGDVRRRLDGRPLVVLLDVDGTLAPIAPRPEEATVPVETRRVVAALAARPAVHVALVSGRTAADARRMVAVSNVWVIGNHGAETVSPDGDELVDAGVAPFERAIAHARHELAALLAAVPGVLVEDKRWTLSVHYRLADPQLVPRVQATVERIAHEHGLRMAGGKMVFEVRPPVRVDKGTAVLTLAQRLGGLAPDAALLFVGDDRTDEDAFRALRLRAARAVTVRVSDDPAAPTAAEFRLSDPVAVRRLLEELVDITDAPRG
jgi:trehalose-phosphatase